MLSVSGLGTMTMNEKMKSPLFTTRHYAAIAEFLNFKRPMRNWLNLVEDFCALFEVDNPRFDREKFIQACLKESTQE